RRARSEERFPYPPSAYFVAEPNSPCCIILIEKATCHACSVRVDFANFPVVADLFEDLAVDRAFAERPRLADAAHSLHLVEQAFPLRDVRGRGDEAFARVEDLVEKAFHVTRAGQP